MSLGVASAVLIGVVACGNQSEDTAVADSAGFAIDDSRVPPGFRYLAPIAERWVLDDVDRAELIARLSADHRRALIDSVEPHLGSIRRWLETYDPATMPDEASAFFWLEVAISFWT